jgi:hypothetical protein
MDCGGFLAMSTIEFAEQWNQPGHRFSNTGAMTAEAAGIVVLPLTLLYTIIVYAVLKGKVGPSAEYQ